MDLDLEQLQQLMQSLKDFDIRELEVERDGERIALKRGTAAPDNLVVAAPPPQIQHMAPVAVAQVPAGGAATAPMHGASEDADPGESDPSIAFITSPFVGTFYRSPSPDDAAFVEEGQPIKTGQVLCIVEAMKLMNEIEAEIGGTLIKVLAENGKPVEYGDRLFKVKKA